MYYSNFLWIQLFLNLQKIPQNITVLQLRNIHM